MLIQSIMIELLTLDVLPSVYRVGPAICTEILG